MTIIQPITKVRGYLQVESSHAILGELSSIFFEASAVQHFESEAARAAFKHRWLGHYLDCHPREAFLAFTAEDRLIGYLVGGLADPALDAHQMQLGYFAAFATHTARYPAHLHLNVASQHRSRGVGRVLLEAFIGHARDNGAPGVHVVTGKGLRNVAFYERNGFVALAEAPWNGRTVVMLGRATG
jgi:GNAT superfamily N-acetyltransferase